MRMNAALNRAAVDAMRMSDPSTRAKPPPAAAPFTAAITGTLRCWSRGINPVIFCWIAKNWYTCPRSSVPGTVPNPPRSAPAQKPRPSPVRIATAEPRQRVDLVAHGIDAVDERLVHHVHLGGAVERDERDVLRADT